MFSSEISEAESVHFKIAGPWEAGSTVKILYKDVVFSARTRVYASSMSFGHPEHCFFDSLDTQKIISEFDDDDFS